MGFVGADDAERKLARCIVKVQHPPGPRAGARASRAYVILT